MAVRISKSKFLESTVAVQATLKGLDDPLPTGGGPLPWPIRDGVAKLTDIWFEDDERNGEGFRAEAEVVLPDSFGGRYIKGKKTKQWVTFNAENLDERISRPGGIRDIIKGLAGVSVFGDRKNIDYIKIVNAIANSIKTKPIYFSFSTSEKQNSEWPWENWHAAIPDFKPPTFGTAPTTPNDPQKKTEHTSSNGVGSQGQAEWYKAAGLPVPNDPVPTPTAWSERQLEPVTAVSDVEYTDTDDLGSVLNRAANKDRAAQDKLLEWVTKLGYTESDFDEASWEEIEGWIKAGKQKGESDPVPTTTPQKAKREVKVDQVFTYSPPNKKEGGARLKARECRVVSVDNIREVVTLQNLANKTEQFEVGYDDENMK